MITKIRPKNVFIISLIFCFVGVTSLSGCTTPQRGVASNSQHQHNEMDVALENIFKSANPGQAAILQYEKLFVLLLKANQFIVQFEKDLDAKLDFKRKNPDAPIEDPLHTETYKQLLKVWNLKERYSHQIEYLYTRSLEIRSDENQPDSQRKIAALVVKDVTSYLEKSRNLQRVELQPIMTSLQKIHSQFMTNYKKNLEQKLKRENKSVKEISAIAIQPTFSRNIFANSAALQQYNSKISYSENDRILDSAEYNNLSSEVDRDLNALPDPIFESRAPQSQDLKCGGGKKLCASVGEDGNIIGGVFPAGVWSFTYDDGPHSAYTPKIMDLFINHKDKVNPKAKATFFWQAVNVGSRPEIVKKAIDNGFPIANHSYNHTDLNTIKTNQAALTQQIITSNKILEDAARKFVPNYKIQYFRCPYGSCYAPKIPVVRQMLANQGQIHAYWRIDSLDWKLKDANQVAPLVIKQMELVKQGVILFHDVQESTIESSRRVLAWVKDQNDNKGKKHRLVTLPEAVDLANGVVSKNEN